MTVSTAGFLMLLGSLWGGGGQWAKGREDYSVVNTAAIPEGMGVRSRTVPTAPSPWPQPGQRAQVCPVAKPPTPHPLTPTPPPPGRMLSLRPHASSMTIHRNSLWPHEILDWFCPSLPWKSRITVKQNHGGGWEFGVCWGFFLLPSSFSFL